MIPDPTIYDQDEGQISTYLLPIKRRLTKFKSWLSSLLSPVQYDHDLIFDGYANGSSAADWVSGNTYAYLDRVVYVDGCVYECINIAGVTSSTPPNQDTANWKKVLDTWIGIRERARYNGQKTMLEYALNKYFKVSITLPFQGSSIWETGEYYTVGNKVYFEDSGEFKLYECIQDTTSSFEDPTDAAYWQQINQIFVENTYNSQSHFWLSNGGNGALTSYMGNSSVFQKFYLGNAYVYNKYVFIIWVPDAVKTAIEANQLSGVTWQEVVRAFAEKYAQAGYLFDIQQNT